MRKAERQNFGFKAKASPYNTKHRTGQDAEHDASRNGLFSFFLFSKHNVRRPHVMVISSATFYTYNSHGNLKLCCYQSIISYWGIIHLNKKKWRVWAEERLKTIANWLYNSWNICFEVLQCLPMCQALVWGSGQYKSTKWCAVFH